MVCPREAMLSVRPTAYLNPRAGKPWASPFSCVLRTWATAAADRLSLANSPVARCLAS
jgi:hypothetical protein